MYSSEDFERLFICYNGKAYPKWASIQASCHTIQIIEKNASIENLCHLPSHKYKQIMNIN